MAVDTAAGTTTPTAPPPLPLLHPPLTRPRLPAGQPRAWYESHNRRIKALRLATALLDTGVYHPTQASDQRIREMAPLVGVRPPSAVTCRLVRTLMLH